MRIQWRKEWTTPAIVGVSSFVAGVGAGVLGYRIKIDKEIDKGLQAMSDLVMEQALPKEDVSAVVDNISPAHRRTGLEYIEKNPSPKEELVNEFTEGLARQNVPAHPALAVPSSDQLPIVADEPEEDELTAEEVFEEITPQPVITNVFEGDPNWDQEKEEASRTTDAPYILHQEEFFRNESGYRQQTLTWYAGDSILTDENDTPIYDTSVIGELQFGKGTNSLDTYYVRNDENRAEYEVIRLDNSYQVTVMGLQAEEEADKDELRHSERITRFRMD